jgi:hypothetical protein
MSFIFFTYTNKSIITIDEALKIGEEKYLKFLWIVDGAFNSGRLDNDFKVNNKSLDAEEKIFTCKYKDKKSKECTGNNFEEEFSKIFSSRIRYDDVYSDGITYAWYKYENGKYIFNDIDNCSINRMGLDHQIKVIKIKSDRIIYEVSFKNENKETTITRDFILVLEDNEWKIEKAYYYDLCELEYNIG